MILDSGLLFWATLYSRMLTIAYCLVVGLGLGSGFGLH